MGYLNKNAILKAYKGLSKLSADPMLQGATQKVSIIRHFLALDSFFNQFHRNCNTRSKEDRKEFIDKVGHVCTVYKDFYTTNFYFPLKEARDCNVGSNFYSAGQVKISLSAPNEIHPYPTRGGYKQLFEIQNGELRRELPMYVNFNDYVTSVEERVALIVWLLRKTYIPSVSDEILDNIKDALSTLYSSELISILIADESQTKIELSKYDMGLNENFYSIREEDIKDLFVKKDENVLNTEIGDNEYLSYLSALRTKPFMLLAGISGTGKSRIVREFAFKSCPKSLQDKAGTTPGNYCMIEVKPNWHDSTELLGYYSRLGKAGYQFTKFVKFLVKAKMFPNVPFFVCLDEMNLAPVEQYFAEILSILETSKHPKNVETGEVDMATVKTEPIIDAQYFRELAEMPHVKNAQTGEPFCSNLTDRDIYLKLFGMDTESDIDTEVGKRTDLTTEGLELPDNVVIIGTVNMDDTTHQFSRKVIDRAMTIEMNGGNLRNMFGGSKNLEYLPESEQKKWQNAFTRRYVSADEVLDAHLDVAEELMEKLPTKLEEINLALNGTPFVVSYRVLNELTIMVGVMLDEGMDLDKAIAASVNNILLMKILPRVEGDAEMFAMSREYKAKAGVSYDNRLEWLKDIAPDIKESSAEAESENDDTEEKTGTVKECQQTAKEKIQEMIDRLNNQEFTRFWP